MSPPRRRAPKAPKPVAAPTPAQTLARHAHLPDEVVLALWQRRPDLRLALAANQHLSAQVWVQLYRPGLELALAEALLWRKLSIAALTHALVGCAEARKGPLAVALSRSPGEASRLIGARAQAGPVPAQVADKILSFGPSAVDEDSRAGLAHSASYKVAVLWFLEDPARVDDDSAYEILTTAAARTNRPWNKYCYPLLIAALTERPALRDRLAACALPAPVYVAARALPGPAAQDAIVATLERWGDTTPATGAVARTLLTQVSTTPAAADRLRPLCDAGGHSGTEGPSGQVCLGVDLATTTDRCVIDLALVFTSDASRWAFQWTTLALNPALTPADRAQLVTNIVAIKTKKALGNSYELALQRARGGSGTITPTGRWDYGVKVAGPAAMQARLGEPYDATGHPHADTGSEVTVAAMAGRPEVARHAGAALTAVLGADTDAWELAFTLADEHGGRVAELAELALLAHARR